MQSQRAFLSEMSLKSNDSPEPGPSPYSKQSDPCSFLALFFALSHGCRPLRASSSPLSLFPYLLAYSYKMNNDQGRDQDVFPERNEFHTDLTPSGLTSADS